MGLSNSKNSIDKSKQLFWIYTVFFLVFIVSNIVFLILRFFIIKTIIDNIWGVLIVVFYNPAFLVIFCYLMAKIMLQAKLDNTYKKMQHFGGFDIITKIILTIMLDMLYAKPMLNTSIYALSVLTSVLLIISIVLNYFVYKKLTQNIKTEIMQDKNNH